MPLTPERRLEVLREMEQDASLARENRIEGTPMWERARDRAETLSDAIKALENAETLRALREGDQRELAEWRMRALRAEHAAGLDAAPKSSAESLQERVEVLEGRIVKACGRLSGLSINPLVGYHTECANAMCEVADVIHGLREALHPHVTHCNDPEHEGACPPGEREP